MPRLILAVTNDLNYDQRMMRICTSLAGQGYEPVLVGRRRRHSRELRQQPYRQVRLNCFWEKGKLFYLEYNLRLLVFLLTNSFDGLCCVDLDTLLPGFLACRIKGRPLVYDAHEYFTEVPEVVRRPAIQKAWEALAGRIIPRLRHAYTVSSSLAGALEDRYGTSFAVIRNLPVRRDNPTSRKPLSPPVVLYQGALNEGRGLRQMIAAMRQIDSAELWLAGEGDLSGPLREQAEREGLQDRVRFLGYIRPEDLPELTAVATLGLNLLENRGLSYYYSLANKTLDYIQAGLPALNPDFPEYAALQRQYRCLLLVNDLSPEYLSARINQLLGRPEELAVVSEQCRLAARELCWEREERSLLAFYNTIFGHSEKARP